MNSIIIFHDDYIVKNCKYFTENNSKTNLKDDSKTSQKDDLESFLQEKQEENFKCELSNNQKIQHLNISPKLLNYDLNDHSLTFERISGITLREIAINLRKENKLNLEEFYEKYIVPCIPLFESLLTVIDEWDPHLGNIIYDNNRFYLIDFSSGCRMTIQRILKHLKININSICIYYP